MYACAEYCIVEIHPTISYRSIMNSSMLFIFWNCASIIVCVVYVVVSDCMDGCSLLSLVAGIGPSSSIFL